MPRTLHEALTEAARVLPAHEAEILIQEAVRAATGDTLTRLELYEPESELRALPAIAEQLLTQWVQRRVRGTPLQHLTGVQEFNGHRYTVSPAVLIPRPETEVLCERVVHSLRARGTAAGEDGEIVVWEIGLGSGVLAIEALLAEPRARAWASELSPRAQQIAERNARELLGDGWAERLTLVHPESPQEVLGAFFRARAPRADLLISNPPYLVQGSEELTEEVARHEPAEALYAPASDALHFYRKIFEGAEQALAPAGQIWLEIPHERAGEIADLARSHGCRAEVLKDLTGRDRVLGATRE